MNRKIITAVPDLALLLAMIGAGALIILTGMELYLKFLLLLLCFSSGYLYQLWLKKTKHRFSVQSKAEQDRIALLMEKAAGMSKVSFRPDKTEEDAELVFSFFKDLMSTEGLILWAREGKEYKVRLGRGIPKSSWIPLKSNDRLVSRIRSFRSPQRIERVVGETQTDKKAVRLSRSLRYWVEKTDLNWVFPLGDKSRFSGFILLSSPRNRLSEFEIALVRIICEKLREKLKGRKLKEEAEKMESQVKSLLMGERKGKEDSSQILKKRLFDLHSLFQATETLYKTKDRERLFFTFTSTVQKQMDSKWVVILLAQEKSKDLVPRCSLGIELGSFRTAVIKKESRFFSWVRERADPFHIYDLDRSLKKERIVTSLLGLGVQLACRFVLPGGDFGIVLLGEKSEGIRYDSTDSANLGILANMATLTLKNIKEFKIIEELSYTDSMTGLYNYRYFYKRLNEEIFRAKRFGRKLSLVIFDIDDFKVYNDTFGHQAGDAVLRQLGKFLLTVVRSIDVVSRYGGEEFCVIMPEADDKECTRFMERLRKSIKDYPFKDEYLEHEHHVTVSLGGAVYPREAADVDRLIYCADMALLRAKSEGRNRSIMFRGEKPALKSVP
jgi:diguanylate cyclase (GGDEF)-like protein